MNGKIIRGHLVKVVVEIYLSVFNLFSYSGLVNQNSLETLLAVGETVRAYYIVSVRFSHEESPCDLGGLVCGENGIQNDFISHLSGVIPLLLVILKCGTIQNLDTEY